jgi:hypothetical protein
MMSILERLYPYTPMINEVGDVDPNSIHSKNTERLLALATTAFAYGAFFRKSTYTWSVIGTVASGVASYYFWSVLGTWVPVEKLAHQNIINTFKKNHTITHSAVRCALYRHPLNGEILKAILNFPDDRARNQLMKSYADNVDQYLVLDTNQPHTRHTPERNGFLKDYFQIELVRADKGRRAILLQQAVVLNYNLNGFERCLPETNEAWIELFTMVSDSATRDLLIDFAEKTQTWADKKKEFIEAILTEAFKALAIKAIENGNTVSSSNFIGRMDTLLGNSRKDTDQAMFSDKLSEITEKIPRNSELGKLVIFEDSKPWKSPWKLLYKHNLAPAD